jgi:transposase
MHRQLPEDGVIKWVKVIRRRWDQRWKYRWVVQFTVQTPEPARWLGDRDSSRTSSLVAVNLGWRQLDSGELRVATWVDDAGKTGEVRLPTSFRDRLRKAHSLRSIRDQNLDQLKELLAKHVPHAMKWRSFERFYMLEHDEELPDAVREEVATWAYRDRHLWWYERGCQRGALKHRREIYRLMALELARTYPTVIVENYDLRDIVEDEDRAQQPSAQRVEGAPSEARAALRSTVSRLGGTLIDGESKLATQECHICGYGREKGERWDAAKAVMHTCKGCGATWDQDVNNARVLLTRAMVLMQKGELKPRDTKRPARFAKRHKAKDEHVEG